MFSTKHPPFRLHQPPQAFSLMELMVVISIITILMVIMVPAMFHFIQYVRHLGGN